MGSDTGKAGSPKLPQSSEARMKHKSCNRCVERF